MRRLRLRILVMLFAAATCGLLQTPDIARADWEITDNFGPVQVGFSLLRRFGWWDDGHVYGTAGATTHNEPPSTVTPDANVITGAMSLPSTFPTSLVTPIEGTGALYEVLYSRPAFYTGMGDFDTNGIVDGRDFLRWQRGGSPAPVSAADLTTWQSNYGLGDGWHNSNTVGDNLVELSLANTDAASFPGFSDVSQYDNPDPNIRGTAMLEFDYVLTYMPPAPEVTVMVAPPFPPQPFKHPSNPNPYGVPDETDVPVEIRFGLLYLDQDTIPANENCDMFGGGNNCWNYVAASGTDFSVVDDTNDTFTQVIDDGDGEYFELIADGEVHTLQIPMTFLTAAERLAEQWMDNQQGLPEDTSNAFWNDPDIVDNLRWATRGGAPHLLVIDNMRLSGMPPAAAVAVPEPATALLAALACTGLFCLRPTNG